MRQQYKLMITDASDYYMESLFILAVQVLLCTAIWCQEGFIDFEHTNDYSMNLCMFFTALVLHFGCIATIRNGI